MSWPLLLTTTVLASALFAWTGGWFVRRFANRFGLIDQPDGGRRRHAKPVPLAGGVAAWAAMLCVGSVLWVFVPALPASFRFLKWSSLVFAAIPLLVIGVLDDRYRLRPAWLLVGALCSILLALGLGIRIEHITHPLGGVATFAPIASLGISALWLLACIGSTKFADGVDGLVAGQTVIGAMLIGWLCCTPAYFQPHVGVLAALFGGSFLGVLLHNWPKAQLFLGEFGSTFAGFGLGVLASISGAKVAIAFMAMGFFAADMLWVMARRVWRGRSPFEGDQTHLHFVLRAAGLPSWAVAMVVWGLGLGFGIAALQFQTQGKIALVGILIAGTWALSYGAEQVARRKAAFFV